MNIAEILAVAAVDAANLGLAVSVYLRNRTRPANRAFGAAAFAIVCWLTFAVLSDQPALGIHALLLNRLTMASAIAMGASLLYFTQVFPNRSGALSALWRAYFAVGAVLAVAAATTPGVVASIKAETWGTNMITGPLLPAMAIWAAGGVLATVYTLGMKYREAVGRPKEQLRYMLLGVALFAIASLFAGLLIPVLTGSYQWAKLNYFSTFLLLGFIAYAMARHRLMDIRMVVLRAAAYALLVVGSTALLLLLIMVGRGPISRGLDLSPDVVFFVAALVLVFGFQPVRYFLEQATDRFLYRRTYDPDQLLRQLGVSMSSALDPESLASLVACSLRREMRLTFAAVTYPHVERTLIRIVGEDDRPQDSELLDFASGYHGDAMLVADDVEEHTEDAISLASCGVRILVPLKSDGAKLSTIVLGSKLSGEVYSAQDLRFLELLASEAAIAMKNAVLFTEKAQRVRELTALNTLAFALGTNRGLDALLDEALGEVVTVTDADSGSMLLLDNNRDVLTIAASAGIPEDIVASTRIPLGEGIAGWVAKHSEPLVLEDGEDPRFADELLRDDIGSAICAPIMSKDKVIGVLNLSRRVGREVFADESMHVATSFAGQLGIAVENARLYTDLERTFLGTITALAAAVDAKDPYTFGHSNWVTLQAVSIAQALGLEEDDVQSIRIAATLHDIGKIGIDSAILLKPGRLTEEERQMINRHPVIGADILAPLDFLKDVVPLVLFHHERYGGGGYPTGISNDAIPLGARIIAVADSFNAMVSDRPYRKALSVQEALKELRDNSGTQFDPVVVDAVVRLVDDVTRRLDIPERGDGSCYARDADTGATRRYPLMSRVRR